jgi:hypothetical protein
VPIATIAIQAIMSTTWATLTCDGGEKKMTVNRCFELKTDKNLWGRTSQSKEGGVQFQIGCPFISGYSLLARLLPYLSSSDACLLSSRVA